MLMLLRRYFGVSAVYPAKGDGDRLQRSTNPDHLLDVFARRGDEIRVITGHFPLAITNAFDFDFRTFTLLRDPVERTLSFLRHQRRDVPEVAEMTLEQIYDDRELFRVMIRNHMTKMLALDNERTLARGLFTDITMTEDDLALAKQHLDSIDVVGVQEDIVGFMRRLDQEFGWQLGESVSANTTAKTERNLALEERIRHDNALDVQLYRYAVDQFIGDQGRREDE